MLRVFSFSSTFFQHFASLSLSPPPTSATPARKFDWTAGNGQDSTQEWDYFSSFLESRGVLLFGTEGYNQPYSPPPTPAVSPFLPTQDEDFVHRQIQTQWRQKEYQHANPFCRMAADERGRDLYVKSVAKASSEWRILEFLTSPALRVDPANHTIPVISVLHHHDQDTVFLVQARWGMFWLWPFLENMKERYEVARQLLEGLAFMHRHGIGHGDIHIGNIVWNYHDTRIYRRSPKYTPVRRNFDFRLAFIDFGVSVEFPVDSLDHHIPCRCEGPPLPYRSPEQEEEGEGKTFDLFAADVYGLGQILIYEASRTETRLPSEYSQLLSEMAFTEPSRRPSAEEAMKRLEAMMRIGIVVL